MLYTHNVGGSIPPQGTIPTCELKIEVTATHKPRPVSVMIIVDGKAVATCSLEHLQEVADEARKLGLP